MSVLEKRRTFILSELSKCRLRSKIEWQAHAVDLYWDPVSKSWEFPIEALIFKEFLSLILTCQPLRRSPTKLATKWLNSLFHNFISIKFLSYKDISWVIEIKNITRSHNFALSSRLSSITWIFLTLTFQWAFFLHTFCKCWHA